jgi:hypothetical protein
VHQHSSASPPINFQKEKNNYIYLYPQNRYKIILASDFLMQYVQIKISRLEFFFIDANKKSTDIIDIFRIQMRHLLVVITS